MERAEKAEWFERVRERYQRGSKTEKRVLLDSLVETLGVHRKSAIRLLRKKNPGRKPKAKRGRVSSSRTTQGAEIYLEANPVYEL
jgi:hypothetical protein